MAKQSKVSEEWYENADGNKLLVTAKFTYSVDIYKFAPRSFNLEDSKYIQSATHSPDKEEYFEKDNAKFKREVYLVGAPLNWLIKNKYVKQ